MLTEEKLKIDAKLSSNEKIQESIESLQIRSNAWAKQKEDDIKSVNYNGLVGLLIECVKNQQKQIDELKDQLNN